MIKLEDSYLSIYQDKFLEIENSHFWYVGRKAIINNLLDKLYARGNSLRIAEIGCGGGGMISCLGRYGLAIGVDIYDKALELCRKRKIPRLCQADALNLPFLNNRLDIICAFDLLEHIDDDLSTLREFFRVCKKGGRLFISVPSNKLLWSSFDEFDQHWRRYNRRELQSKVKEAGFTIEKLSYTMATLFPLIFIVRKERSKLARDREICLDKSDLLKKPNKLINRLLELILRLEARLIKIINFPFGSSLICIAKKA